MNDGSILREKKDLNYKHRRWYFTLDLQPKKCDYGEH